MTFYDLADLGDFGSATPTHRSGPATHAGYHQYGCAVNAIGPEALFARYAQTRFLYPAKRQRLAPYWPRITDNWTRAQRAGELLHWVLTYDNGTPDGWASLTSWRSTHHGWQTQHLVSTGGPRASRSVLLAGQAVRISDGWDHAHQNWFRPANRFAAAAFGGMTAALPSDLAAVVAGEYLFLPKAAVPADPTGTLGQTVRLDGGRTPELADLATRTRGPVYATAEELDRDDLLLDQVDQLYRLVGLRRYRRVSVLQHPNGRLVGAALAYRGPLGFNFSFLENRCDLLIDPSLAEADSAAAVRQLLAAAVCAYTDFELPVVPIVADAATARVLLTLGAERIQQYSQAIWLAAGFTAWYQHIETLYQRRLGTRAEADVAARITPRGGAL